MRIGVLAKRASVSRDTIRFYERKGLILSRPSASATNSYRDYPEETVLTIGMIREARAAGFTIAELREFLRQMDRVMSDEFDGEAFLQQKIDEVEENIRRSRRFLKTLKATQLALERSP